MRLAATGVAAIALAAVLSGCIRVEPEDAAERALIGGTLGVALGTGIGATFAINPGIGAVIGAETGGAIGMAIGVATARPTPTYAPIAPPAAAVIPSFYDGWPPGFHRPPDNPETQPPRAG